jgi:hypothetical protein
MMKLFPFAVIHAVEISDSAPEPHRVTAPAPQKGCGAPKHWQPLIF